MNPTDLMIWVIAAIILIIILIIVLLNVKCNIAAKIIVVGITFGLTMIIVALYNTYKELYNSIYPHTNELITAQRHLLNISDYILNLEYNENNNNVFTNWCDNEVLEQIKQCADSVNTFNKDYDNFINNKKNGRK